MARIHQDPIYLENTKEKLELHITLNKTKNVSYSKVLLNLPFSTW